MRGSHDAWTRQYFAAVAGANWGLGFVAQSSAMGSVGPFMFVTLRFSSPP
ncbi:hypothetical protein [Phyllobacterium bourgognense]